MTLVWRAVVWAALGLPLWAVLWHNPFTNDVRWQVFMAIVFSVTYVGFFIGMVVYRMFRIINGAFVTLEERVGRLDGDTERFLSLEIDDLRQRLRRLDGRHD